MRVAPFDVAYDIRSMREDFKGSLWILMSEGSGRATLAKFLDTTAMKRVALELPNLDSTPSTGGTSGLPTELLDITEDKDIVVFVSPADSLNMITVKGDRTLGAGKVLKSTDQFLSIISRNKLIYGLYQTIIGELILGIWNMNFSPVTVISYIGLLKVLTKDCR